MSNYDFDPDFDQLISMLPTVQDFSTLEKIQEIRAAGLVMFATPGDRDDVEKDAPTLVAGRDVQECDLVRLLVVVHLGRLDRVAGIDVVDVSDTLDDASLVDVEAGNDSLQEHDSFLRVRPMSTSPV